MNHPGAGVAGRTAQALFGPSVEVGEGIDDPSAELAVDRAGSVAAMLLQRPSRKPEMDGRVGGAQDEGRVPRQHHRPAVPPRLDLAPARPEGRELFALADVLIFNQTELAAYSGLPHAPADAKACVDAARSLMLDAQNVVVTLGADGALLIGARDAAHIPGRTADVVDTVGAGDCFCGVLAAGLDAGLSLRDAIERANVAAALAVARAGAADAMPTRAEIEAACAARL